jgi:hypothetical protein
MVHLWSILVGLWALRQAQDRQKEAEKAQKGAKRMKKVQKDIVPIVVGGLHGHSSSHSLRHL